MSASKFLRFMCCTVLILFSLRLNAADVPSQPQNAVQPQTISLAITDYDSTVTNDFSPHEQIDGKTNGIYQSGYLLVKVKHSNLRLHGENQRPVVLEELPSIVFVPMIDYRRLNEDFATSSGVVGGGLKQITLSNGTTMIPGLYYFDHNISLKRFRSDEGVNYLLEEIKASYTIMQNLHTRANPHTLRGLAFPVLELGMTPHPLNPSRSLLDLMILTMRGHSEEHVQEAIQEIATREKISNPVTGQILSQQLSHSDHDMIHFEQSDANKKWEKILNALQSLQRSPLPEGAGARLHPDGSEFRKTMHYATYFEDDTRIFNFILPRLRALVRSQRLSNVKVGVVCAATQFEYEEHIRPPNLSGGMSRTMIIKPNGSSRPMTNIEKIGEPIAYSDEKEQRKFEKNLLESFTAKCPLSFM